MNQKGAVIVVVAALMFVFVGVAALALDLSHLFLVRNELQNAADAAALAGVRVLYNPDGFVNPGANVTAMDAAVANKSQKLPVEVIVAEIQRGHWSFSDGSFTQVDSLEPITMVPPYSFVALDSNPGFVNAVRVKTRRGGTPGGTQAFSLFSRIWGYLGFNLAATATAYIGFAQGIEPDSVDKPIAICLQAITIDGMYSCVTGRMINSSGSGPDTNTGGWTNYSQGSYCSQPSARDMSDILTDCGGTNSRTLYVNSTIGISNGMQDSTYEQRVDSFRNCWKRGKYDTDGDNIPDTQLPVDSRGYPTKPWRIKIPVIDCGNDLGPINGCRRDVLVKGTVTVDVLWVSQGGSDPHFHDIPTQMEDWSCTGTNDLERQNCWDSFATRFDLKNYDQGGAPTPYMSKSVYVKPVCEPYVGPTVGPMFSFFWQNPVLVD